MRSRIAALSAALGLTLALTLSACGSHAHAGARVTTEERPHGRDITLVSPLGTATVTVGTPVDTVSHDQANDGKDHHAPKGGAFVPVSWSFSYASGFPAANTDAGDKTATISLISGRHHYDLDTIGHTFGTRLPQYVAVGSTRGLQVGLTYDGLTQTASVSTGKRTRGVADALYAGSPRTIDCSQGWRTTPTITAPMDCTLRVATTPWAGAWAKPGRTYVVVEADIRPSPLEIRRGAGYARYDVRSITDHSALDDVAPSPTLTQEPSVPYAASGTQVFDVPTGAHTLDLQLSYALQRSGGTAAAAPAHPTVTFSRTVALP